MTMSIFPTGRARNGQRAAIDRDARLETDGVLVRPLSGQIYLIEEADLAGSPDSIMQPRLSGLISRH
jgi:hypothetical protein